MTHLDLEKGIKYLGFNLNLNSYKFEDWIWLYNKIKATIL